MLLLLLLLVASTRGPIFCSVSGGRGGRVRWGRRRLWGRALQRREVEVGQPRYEVSSLAGAVPEIFYSQVSGVGGTGEEVVGGVGSQAAGWAAVAGGPANGRLVGVEGRTPTSSQP